MKLSPADRKIADVLATSVAELALTRTVPGLDELDSELTEYQIEFLAQVIVNAAEELGFAYGGGHLPQEPRAFAAWMLLGEDSDWPPSERGGVPPIWVWLKKAFDHRYGEPK